MSSKSEVFEFSRGRRVGGGVHVTCNAHFRTRISYSSQKSCVKIWFWLVEPFKNYHLNFLWGQKPPIGGGGATLTYNAHVRTWPSYSSQKSYVEILVRIGRAFQELSCPQTSFYGAKTPYWGGGGYIWPVNPIFELRWVIPVKSHVWKFGLDWLKSEVC